APGATSTRPGEKSGSSIASGLLNHQNKIVTHITSLLGGVANSTPQRRKAGPLHRRRKHTAPLAAPRTGPPQPASFLVGTGTGPGNVAQRGPRHPTARH